jgi:hypothetical protein
MSLCLIRAQIMLRVGTDTQLESANSHLNKITITRKYCGAVDAV